MDVQVSCMQTRLIRKVLPPSTMLRDWHHEQTVMVVVLVWLRLFQRVSFQEAPAQLHQAVGADEKLLLEPEQAQAHMSCVLEMFM